MIDAAASTCCPPSSAEMAAEGLRSLSFSTANGRKEAAEGDSGVV